jgi:murein DD-endopeptidase MepM/ murein hydrolase activator NlpD
MGNGTPGAGNANAVPAAADPTKTAAGAIPEGTTLLVNQGSAVVGQMKGQRQAINNWAPPTPQKSPGQNVFAYLTAPVRLKRLLGSPLVQTGMYASGPKNERRVLTGWSNTGETHYGIDFVGTLNENVLACASGRVASVGYDNIEMGSVQVPGAHTTQDGNVVGADGKIVAVKPHIGNNGIGVIIRHDGDFAGYLTEYYHLAKTVVKVGDAITEGQVIGQVGQTGLASVPCLYFVLSFSLGGRPVLVDPTILVPNSFPGHLDSTSPSDKVLNLSYINPGPGGQNLVTGFVATALRTVDRSTDLQNTDRQAIALAQAGYTAYVAQTVGQQQQQLLEAAAKFQKAGIVVQSPMTFDFENGYWIDGTDNKRPV